MNSDVQMFPCAGKTKASVVRGLISLQTLPPVPVPSPTFLQIRRAQCNLQHLLALTARWDCLGHPPLGSSQGAWA